MFFELVGIIKYGNRKDKKRVKSKGYLLFYRRPKLIIFTGIL